MNDPGATPPADSEAASRVGRYQLIRRLGAGGMGEVYLAHDLQLGRQVAIKHPLADGNEEQRARFRREAWAAARLAHPAIVPVFDVLSDGRGDWIVMELVDGPTLREQLEVRGMPVLATALDWAAQIAEGLAAAHDQGIVHRDVKAENVMLAPSGHLKIVDFGLAKSFTGEGMEAALSASGALLGTLRSMAPEQARGRPADPRADLFSFGVLLHELLTGKPPFTGASPAELVVNLAVAPHPRLLAADPSLPRELEELVDELLAKAPEARPASAREVAARLRAVLAGLGPAAAGPATAPWPASWRQGTDSHLLDAGSASTFFGGGAGEPAAAPAPPLTAASPEAAPEAAAKPSRRRRRALLAAIALVGLGITAEATRRGLRASGAPAAAAAEPLALYRAGMAELEEWYRPGKVEAAIGHFQQALAAQPHSAPSLAGLSRAYWYRSKLAGRDAHSLEQARAVAEQALRFDQHLAAAQLGLAFAAIELGDPAAAEAALAKAEQLEPSALAAYGRGLLASARGEPAAAEAAYRQALERRESAEVWNALGYLELRGQRLDEAERAFARAIELAPDAVFGHRNLATVHFSRGNPAAAAAELQRAIEIDPQATLYTNLGTILFYQGLYAEAEGAFRHAIDRAGDGVATNTALLWANLGDCYRMLPGRGEDARLAFRRAVQLIAGEAAAKSGDGDLRSRLGLYLAKAGETEAARRELATAQELDGGQPASRLRALLAYEAMGDRPAALAALRRALAAGLAWPAIENEPELAGLRADPAYHRLAAAGAAPGDG